MLLHVGRKSKYDDDVHDMMIMIMMVEQKKFEQLILLTIGIYCCNFLSLAGN